MIFISSLFLLHFQIKFSYLQKLKLTSSLVDAESNG
nr:MAG TPA: hypothetical protein [Caudoviricetes sp.]